ncbi:hypothetical protein [Paenibacillus herberti]|uniref:hypothetical protein n=1 Tax=Paenibacillus herberti TaxID=1619309 RepID=UPI001595D846|nr:hypothetical protein [Paenibacillus herberti]
MVDLHELLSWIWSIGLACSAAYYYLAWLHSDDRKAYALPHATAVGAPSEIRPASGVRPIGQRLVRLLKRKESPDDDSSACPSFVDGRSVMTREDIHATIISASTARKDGQSDARYRRYSTTSRLRCSGIN